MRSSYSQLISAWNFSAKKESEKQFSKNTGGADPDKSKKADYKEIESGTAIIEKPPTQSKKNKLRAKTLDND